MKKKGVIIVIIVLILLFIKNDVYAANECTTDELRALKMEALNVDFQFNLVEPEDSGYYLYYEISTVNFNSNLKLFIMNHYYVNEAEDKYSEITIPTEIRLGQTKKIEIYGSYDSACPNELLLTKTITAPYYNEYSKREECKGYENYDICKLTSNTENITEEQFQQAINNIKNSVPLEEETKENIIHQIYEFIQKNLIITIIIIVSFIILIILLIYIIVKRKNKNKVKISLE